LTPEAMDDPLIALDQARRSRNLQESRFRTLEFGESFRVPRNVPEREAGSWKREAGS
jgi:hypothetical protein